MIKTTKFITYLYESYLIPFINYTTLRVFFQLTPYKAIKQPVDFITVVLNMQLLRNRFQTVIPKTYVIPPMSSINYIIKSNELSVKKKVSIYSPFAHLKRGAYK